MIQILFTIIVAEMGLVMILLFKTPFRKILIMGLDRVKRGRRGPMIVKTVAGTVFFVLMASLYSMQEIRNRLIHATVVNPTDQVLLGKVLLQTSLMGFSLFLAWMIDRLHHYIRELRLLRKGMETVKKQHRCFEDENILGGGMVKLLEKEITDLKRKIRQLETDYEAKVHEFKGAEANAVALWKQTEGFLLEYDRLQEENQNLRSQLISIDRKLSRSNSKK